MLGYTKSKHYKMPNDITNKVVYLYVQIYSIFLHI